MPDEPTREQLVLWIRNLQMLTIRLARKLPKDDELRKKAFDYLQREGLSPSPLREEAEIRLDNLNAVEDVIKGRPASRVDIDVLQRLYDAIFISRFDADGFVLGDVSCRKVNDLLSSMPQLLAEVRELRELAEALRFKAKRDSSIINDISKELAVAQEQNRRLINGILDDLSLFVGEQQIVKMIRERIDAALAKE